MLDVFRATLRPGHGPQLPVSCGVKVSSGSQGPGVSAWAPLWGRRKLHGGGCVREQLGQLRPGSGMPSAEILVEEQTWQEGAPPMPRLQVPGGSPCWGSHEYGVGSLKKGLSVHPEVAFRALRAEEVTVTGSKNLFSPCLGPQLIPTPLGLSATTKSPASRL